MSARTPCYPASCSICEMTSINESATFPPSLPPQYFVNKGVVTTQQTQRERPARTTSSTVAKLRRKHKGTTSDRTRREHQGQFLTFPKTPHVPNPLRPDNFKRTRSRPNPHRLLDEIFRILLKTVHPTRAPIPPTTSTTYLQQPNKALQSTQHPKSCAVKCTTQHDAHSKNL